MAAIPVFWLLSADTLMNAHRFCGALFLSCCREAGKTVVVQRKNLHFCFSPAEQEKTGFYIGFSPILLCFSHFRILFSLPMQFPQISAPHILFYVNTIEKYEKLHF